MDIKKYLKFAGLTQKEFAYMLGVSMSALSNYIHKRREPRKAVRNKMIELSNGKITLKDLLCD